MISSRALFAIVACAAMSLTACGGHVETGSGGGGTSTSTGGGGSFPVLPPGGCLGSNDCPTGECIPITEGGYKVCTHATPEAQGCPDPGGPVPDECCSSADCKQGKCYLSTNVPLCGGVQPDYNECVVDECAADSDCNLGVPALCAPAGVYGPNRRCVAAYCKTNADCNAEPNGMCAPIQSPCCALPVALACVYPGGCKSLLDCGSDNNKHCEIDPTTKEGVCVDGLVGCPE